MSDDLTIPSPAYRAPRRARAGIDPGTKRLLMIAGGLGLSLVAVIGASSLLGRHSGEVPVVQADDRPIRVKPENPGGMQVAGANNEIFSGADTAVAKLAPAAEMPDPKALRAPAPPPVAAAAPAVIAPPPAPPAQPAKQVAAAAPPPPVAKPAPQAHATPVVAAAPAQAAPVAEKRPAAAGSRAPVVQLAALSSEEAAKTEWQNLNRRMPDLLGGHQPSFIKAERDGRTFWRVRTAGFADVAQAKSFCERVRAKNGGCSVIDF